MKNWIKSSDKLPDTDREVLVIVKYTDTPIQAYYSMKGGFWSISVEVMEFITVHAGWSGGYMESVLNDYEVTHWIELPKLPNLKD